MESTRAPWSGQTGWHAADWGSWGWAETVIKLVGIVVGIGAAIDDGALAIPDTHRLSYWILFAIAVGYIGAIFDRFTDREIVAMGFAVLMVVGHWAMVFAMGRSDWPGRAVAAFAGLMLIGDLIKIAFFVVTRTGVRSLPWTVPLAMTSALALGYLIALVAAS